MTVNRKVWLDVYFISILMYFQISSHPMQKHYKSKWRDYLVTVCGRCGGAML